MTYKCTCCDCEFNPPQPLGVIDSLVSTRRYIPLEEFTHVKCPRCGAFQLASERRFFGVLGPLALQISSLLLMSGILIWILIVLIETLKT